MLLWTSEQVAEKRKSSSLTTIIDEKNWRKNMYNKYILLVVISLLMVFTLTGCSVSNGLDSFVASESSESESSLSEETATSKS